MASQTMLAGMKFSITGTPNSHDSWGLVLEANESGSNTFELVTFWSKVGEGLLKFILLEKGFQNFICFIFSVPSLRLLMAISWCARERTSYFQNK